MKSARVAWVVVGLAGWASSSCAPGGFQSESEVHSVRILGSQADQPYAKPGSTIRLQVLAYDGRAVKPAPMIISWIPFICKNPQDDAYYSCFRRFLVGDGGPGPGGTAPALDPALWPTGSSFEFVMPADIIATHANNPPPPQPYGLAILFNVACAGHLEFVPTDPGNVQSPPIGCFDAQHRRLGANDYVFGFTRVYAYTDVGNANPVIDHVDVEGQRVDLRQGFQVQPCPAGNNCSSVHIGPVVPATSWENNPVDRDTHGNPVHEQIWADFFSTFGSFTNEARLLYDPKAGLVGGPSDTDNQFQPPSEPGEGTIWIVVHDNRGGASWAEVPVHVKNLVP
jgi:hypothetical protein